MEDQVGSFSSRGITSVKTGSCSDHETSQCIINGEYQLVFISPEALLSKKRWRKMLLCDVYQRNLVAVVVDEAHCVRYWYVIANVMNNFVNTFHCYEVWAVIVLFTYAGIKSSIPSTPNYQRFVA